MHPKQTKNTLRTKTESSADRHTDRSKTEVCTGWVLTRRQPQTDQQVQTQRAQTAVSARARAKKAVCAGAGARNNHKHRVARQRFARGLGHGASQQHPPNWRRLTALASLSRSRKSGEPLQNTCPPSRSSPPLLVPQRRLRVKILPPC